MSIRLINTLTVISVYTLLLGTAYADSGVPEFSADEDNYYNDEKTQYVGFGTGIGLDYGGLIGLNVNVCPYKYVNFFTAGGFYVIGFGYQLGMKGYVIPRTNAKTVRPYGKIMYGSNSLLIVNQEVPGETQIVPGPGGIPQFVSTPPETINIRKIYHGFTIGPGVEFRFGNEHKNGFDINLHYFVRSSEFESDVDYVEGKGITLSPLIPVGFSIGYHHEF